MTTLPGICGPEYTRMCHFQTEKKSEVSNWETPQNTLAARGNGRPTPAPTLSPLVPDVVTKCPPPPMFSPKIYTYARHRHV